MTINHTLNHYVIGGVALALSAATLIAAGTVVPAMQQKLAAVHVSRLAYPGLDDARSAALTAILAAMGQHDLTIWCVAPVCADLSEDIQYAAYQADWDTHAETFSVYTLPKGITVAPDDADGHQLGAAIAAATGLKVSFMTISDKTDAEGLSVIIGDR